jgi:hypothetical protein
MSSDRYAGRSPPGRGGARSVEEEVTAGDSPEATVTFEGEREHPDEGVDARRGEAERFDHRGLDRPVRADRRPGKGTRRGRHDAVSLQAAGRQMQGRSHGGRDDAAEARSNSAALAVVHGPRWPGVVRARRWITGTHLDPASSADQSRIE